MELTNRKARPSIPEDTRVREKRVFKQMKLEEVKKLISSKCGNTKITTYGLPNDNAGEDIVIFLPAATQEFESMIHWGEVHPINRDEQLYEGIGHIVMDGNRRIIVISHFLYIYAAERTPVSACIFNGSFNSVMSRIEYEIGIYVKNEKKCNVREDGTLFDPFVYELGPSEPVLYGHTHPGLGTFFSPPDRVSGFATPNLPAVTFVADPFRKEMKAGVGVELTDAHIIVYSYDAHKDESSKAKSLSDSRVNATNSRTKEPVKVSEIISEISRGCSELLNPLYGAKGKFTSYTTIGGAQKIKMEMTWKPEKKAVKSTITDTRVVGKTYDSYA